jgi:hypothetical protein
MRRLTLLLVLVAFTFSCGGQWYVLQCLAWTNMIREYSQMVPLSQAVEMTFSGQYPCELCKIIAQKEQSQNLKIAALHKQEKKQVSDGVVLALPPRSVSPQIFPVRPEFLQTRSDAPPIPPPRLA